MVANRDVLLCFQYHVWYTMPNVHFKNIWCNPDIRSSNFRLQKIALQRNFQQHIQDKYCNKRLPITDNLMYILHLYDAITHGSQAPAPLAKQTSRVTMRVTRFHIQHVKECLFAIDCESHICSA